MYVNTFTGLRIRTWTSLGEQYSPYHTGRQINDMGQINDMINGMRFLRKLELIKSKSKGVGCFVFGAPDDLLGLRKDIQGGVRQLRAFSLK